LKFHPRYPTKKQNERDAINLIVDAIDRFVREERDNAMNFAQGLDPGLQKIEKEGDRRDWYSNLLGRLLKERRQEPKEERIQKYRDDSVDEIDTTDLEHWSFKPELEVLERGVWAAEDQYDEWEHLDANGRQDLIDVRDVKADNERLASRHRLDFAKLFLGKDGGYTLRKFKQIMKREMEEHPEKYEILRPG